MENEEDVPAFEDYQPPVNRDNSTSVQISTNQSKGTTPEVIPQQPQTATLQPTTHQNTPSLDSTACTPSQQTDCRVFASPFARMLAAQKGINLEIKVGQLPNINLVHNY